jgi:hypothetical protein
MGWAELPGLTTPVSPRPRTWPNHQVFLKSDSLCLMEGRRFRAQPTLPSARLLAMHIQQLETGGFTMTNGAHRWSKLRCVHPPVPLALQKPGGTCPHSAFTPLPHGLSTPFTQVTSNHSSVNSVCFLHFWCPWSQNSLCLFQQPPV